MRVDECRVLLENPSDKKAPEKSFLFDSAYDGSSNNDTIYSDICYSLVESVLEGYNSTIFAYGQTGYYVYLIHQHLKSNLFFLFIFAGCGKSYTMQVRLLLFDL